MLKSREGVEKTSVMSDMTQVAGATLPSLDTESVSVSQPCCKVLILQVVFGPFRMRGKWCQPHRGNIAGTLAVGLELGLQGVGGQPLLGQAPGGGGAG